MARLTRDAIVAQLEGQGLHFRSVTLETEGEYLPTDVDWNNKDVPHLNHIHTWVKDVTFVVDRDLQASVSLQKVFGIPFPLVLVHYDNGPNHQTHVVTLLAWTVITRHDFVPLTATRTRAITTYTVGSSRFWMLLFPIVRRAIRRNYRQLMSEDVPLRERRGLLRSWGYTYRGDDDGPRDIRASLSITSDNVLPPATTADEPAPTRLPLAGITDRGWTLVGRSDHLGLKLTRRGSRILAYPRMCPHEGADLDGAADDDGCLTCPWHGRRIAPVAVLELEGGEPTVESPHHRFSVHEDHLSVESVRPHSLGSTPTG